MLDKLNTKKNGTPFYKYFSWCLVLVTILLIVIEYYKTNGYQNHFPQLMGLVFMLIMSIIAVVIFSPLELKKATDSCKFKREESFINIKTRAAGVHGTIAVCCEYPESKITIDDLREEMKNSVNKAIDDSSDLWGCENPQKIFKELVANNLQKNLAKKNINIRNIDINADLKTLYFLSN